MYLPLRNGVALYLNKCESHSPKDALCQSLVEIGPVVLEILKFRKCIFPISLSSLQKGCGPSFEQTCIQGCFVPSLVEIDPMVLEKKMEI